jgi:hypothetical protein
MFLKDILMCWFVYIFCLSLFSLCQIRTETDLYKSEPDIFRINPVQDTMPEKKIIFNGRVWTYLYNKVKGDAFLFSGDFLHGSITFNGKRYNDIRLKYDILNDEVISFADPFMILQLNKEMVERFSFDFDNKTYQFLNLGSDSANVVKGYVNVLYEGKTALYIKYKKEIELLGYAKKYDLFFQTHRIYIMNNGVVYPVTGRRNLVNILEDKRDQIRHFLRLNNLYVWMKNPDSFIRILEFYDSLGP